MSINSIFNKENRLFITYILMMLMVFSPSKAIGQISGVVTIFLLLFFAGVDLYKSIIKITIFMMVYISIGLLFFVFKENFLFFNYIFFLITSSSFLLIFIDFRKYITTEILVKIFLFTCFLLLFESFYGIAQGVVGFLRSGSFDISNGDLVRGTIDPRFYFTRSASNPIFAILISSLLVFVTIFTHNKITLFRLSVIGISLVAWILSSVMHTVLFFACAVVVIYVVRGILFFDGKRTYSYRQVVVAALVGLFVLGSITILLPRNLALIPSNIKIMLDISPYSFSEKSRVTYNTLFLLPQEQPLQPWLGLGAGQYSSRASLMRSGQYLNEPIPFVRPAMTEETNVYVISLWQNFLRTKPFGGSTYFPFYSWLTLYAEFGIVGMASFFVFMLYIMIRLLKTPSKTYPQMNFWIAVLLLYVLFLGYQDNYWEFTQAIFPVCFIIKICYDFMQQERELKLTVEPVNSNG